MNDCGGEAGTVATALTANVAHHVYEEESAKFLWK